MPVQNYDRVVTKQDLSDFYQAIRPYLAESPSSSTVSLSSDSLASNVSDPERVVTKQDLRDFYDAIYPYLAGVSSNIKIVPFATGTDEEITAMLNAHYAGLIDIRDYWSVGDTRDFTLSPYYNPAYKEDESEYASQLIILDNNGKELVTPIGEITRSAFVVGIRQGTVTGDNIVYDNIKTRIFGLEITDTGAGSLKWSNCGIRTSVLNGSLYQDGLPAYIRNIIKQHVNHGPIDGQSTQTDTTYDYIAIPSEREINGTATSVGNQTAQSSDYQFAYFAQNGFNFIRNGSYQRGIKFYTRTLLRDSKSNGAVVIRSDVGQPTASNTISTTSLEGGAILPIFAM